MNTAQQRRRSSDEISPEEKIYPLRFTSNYIAEKKNYLLSLESQSMRDVMRLQRESERLMAMCRKVLAQGSRDEQDIYELIKSQHQRLNSLMVDMTKKSIVFEDMNNILQQQEPLILRLIFRDSLTNTYNRYFFLSRSAELMVSSPPDIGFSLAFIDIDNFKQCNDVYGHEYGDVVLKTLCNITNDHIGQKSLKGTFLVRMGGDEFIVISQELPFADFVSLLTEIQQHIENEDIRYNQTVGHITVSIGAANTADSQLKDQWELYRLADSRLYEAKNRGKNQIVAQ